MCDASTAIVAPTRTAVPKMRIVSTWSNAIASKRVMRCDPSAGRLDPRILADQVSRREPLGKSRRHLCQVT